MNQNAISLRRAELQQLTDQLIAEYAASVPAGQVMAAVIRAQRQLPRADSFWSPDRIAQCEFLARQHLSARSTALLSPAS
jgi:hypothetical protein